MNELIEEYQSLLAIVVDFEQNPNFEGFEPGWDFDRTLDKLGDIELEICNEAGLAVDMNNYEPDQVSTLAKKYVNGL
jgi:hypothetical protein